MLEARLGRTGKAVRRHGRDGTATPADSLGAAAGTGETMPYGLHVSSGDLGLDRQVLDFIGSLHQDAMWALGRAVKSLDPETAQQIREIIIERAPEPEGYPPALHEQHLHYAALLLPVENEISRVSGNEHYFDPWGHFGIEEQPDLPSHILCASAAEQARLVGRMFMCSMGWAMDDNAAHEDDQWVGENVERLIPYVRRLLRESQFSREFCEAVIGHAAVSLGDGLL